MAEENENVALGYRLLDRAIGPAGDLADIEDAGVALKNALDEMPPEHPQRLRATVLLALQQATRYAAFAGAGEHRDAAMSYAEAGLASGHADAGTSDTCHLVIAWMALTSRLTGPQRATTRNRPSLEAARGDGPLAAALLAELGTFDIRLEDAETTIAHLRQVSAADAAGEHLRTMVPGLWTVALFILARAGRVTSDIARVADDLRLVASQTASGAHDHAELLAMRAALLAIAADGSGGSDERKTSADALRDAATLLPAGHPARTALFTGLGVALNQRADDAVSADDVAAEAEWIVETLERLPPDAPDYGRMLTSVAIRLLTLQLSNRNAVPLDRVIAQLARALEQLAPDDLARPFAEIIYWGAIGWRAARDHRTDVAGAAVEQLMRCEAALPAGHVFHPFAAMGVACGLGDLYAMTGELRQIERASEYLQDAFDRVAATGLPAGAERAFGVMLHLRGLLALMVARYDGAERLRPEIIDDLAQAAELVGTGDPLYPRITADLDMARALRGITTALAASGIPFRGAERNAFDRTLETAESMSRDHPDFPGLAGAAAAGLMLRAVTNRDMSLVARAIALSAEACAVPGLNFRERPRLLNLHGSAMLTRYQFTSVPRDLSNAIDRLEEARRAVEQESGSQHAGDVLESLSRAYRYRADAARLAPADADDRQRQTTERADTDRAVDIGLASLREHAGDVLLQDSDENALAVARRSTGDAVEMARWFAARGRPGPAVAALELGRAMVLHAGTIGAAVEEVLRDAGHADLAGEWVRGAAAGNATGDLRYRVMTAIEGSWAEARLFSTPRPDEIGAALAECDADVLIYLLPRGDDGPGLAILIEPGGQVRQLPLPGLYLGVRSPARAALRARQEADAAAAAPDRDPARLAAARKTWLDALGKLCDWAWSAVIGPLLDAVPARSGAAERRLVLVPGGELALVAWHAARRLEGGGYRYACQDAVFSYAPSARQFADLAWRRPRRWAYDPVLISDSAASLYTTAAGIGYLYTEHYAAGSVFGYAHARLAPAVPGSDAATPADVLAAMPHTARLGASLLHFGCHGRAQVPVMASWLSLGKGGALAVRDILRQGRRWQAGRRAAGSGGLVVLASCLSDVAEADFDEALTLATAFMSAGATGVVAAKWSVAAAQTALFMAMFHHYLNGAHPDPSRALRAAQLWMLNPDRTMPDRVPAVLRDEARGSALAEPEAWAGFAYQGR